jgi:hypothetical protein
MLRFVLCWSLLRRSHIQVEAHEALVLGIFFARGVEGEDLLSLSVVGVLCSFLYFFMEGVIIMKLARMAGNHPV